MSPKSFIGNIFNNETILLLIFSDINHEKKKSKECLPPQLTCLSGHRFLKHLDWGLSFSPLGGWVGIS